MTTIPTTLSQVEQCNKLLYIYIYIYTYKKFAKKEEDWSSHLATREFGHNHCFVTGSRYFSPYFCLTTRNLVMPVDSKIFKSKHSSSTDADEYAMARLPKLDHVREWLDLM